MRPSRYTLALALGALLCVGLEAPQARGARLPRLSQAVAAVKQQVNRIAERRTEKRALAEDVRRLRRISPAVDAAYKKGFRGGLLRPIKNLPGAIVATGGGLLTVESVKCLEYLHRLGPFEFYLLGPAYLGTAIVGAGVAAGGAALIGKNARAEGRLAAFQTALERPELRCELSPAALRYFQRQTGR